MATLKIPELALFGRKSVHHHHTSSFDPTAINSKMPPSYSRFDHPHHDTQIDNRKVYHSPSYKYSSQNTYKQIADHYLQKKSHIPVFLEPTPFVPSMRSYPEIIVNHSPLRSAKSSRKCDCENGYSHSGHSKGLQNSRYVSAHRDFKGEQRIEKDPYLIHTFRPAGNQIRQKKSVEKNRNASFYLTDKILERSKIVQRIHTNESREQSNQLSININGNNKKNNNNNNNNNRPPTHTTQIQTERLNNSSIINSVTQKVISRTKQKSSLERAIHQHQLNLQHLQDDIDNDNVIDLARLENSKNQYFEKSQAILQKLNLLAENQPVALSSQFFNGDQKNVFWPVANSVTK